MPDAKVQAAIANWAPRFIAQGVDYNDFVRTTSQIEHWDEWLDAWCALGAMHEGMAQEAEAKNYFQTAGEAHVRAALSYHFAKFVWLEDLAKYRAASDKSVASLYAAHRCLGLHAERLEIPFEGATMLANLRLPAGDERPPLVLLLPGLDSTKEEFFYWEEVFLMRGMATLSLDGPGQGETGYVTHIRPDYEAAVSAALDFIAPRQDLDLTRIATAGVSLGGYYAPRAAAYEPRLKAVAAIAGPFNFGECWDGLPPLTRAAFRYHSGAHDDDEAHRKALELDLTDALPRLQQPMLVVFGKLDRLIPWEQAERVARSARNARLVMYPEGNHVCNNIPYKYRPLVADWIKEMLDVG